MISPTIKRFIKNKGAGQAIAFSEIWGGTDWVTACEAKLIQGAETDGLFLPMPCLPKVCPLV